jgi:hypothetical protein
LSINQRATSNFCPVQSENNKLLLPRVFSDNDLVKKILQVVEPSCKIDDMNNFLNHFTGSLLNPEFYKNNPHIAYQHVGHDTRDSDTLNKIVEEGTLKAQQSLYGPECAHMWFDVQAKRFASVLSTNPEFSCARDGLGGILINSNKANIGTYPYLNADSVTLTTSEDAKVEVKYSFSGNELKVHDPDYCFKALARFNFCSLIYCNSFLTLHALIFKESVDFSDASPFVAAQKAVEDINKLIDEAVRPSNMDAHLFGEKKNNVTNLLKIANTNIIKVCQNTVAVNERAQEKIPSAEQLRAVSEGLSVTKDRDTPQP